MVIDKDESKVLNIFVKLTGDKINFDNSANMDRVHINFFWFLLKLPMIDKELLQPTRRTDSFAKQGTEKLCVVPIGNKKNNVNTIHTSSMFMCF